MDASGHGTIATADDHAQTASADESVPPVDLSVRLGRLTLATPVMPASGCFGPELANILPIDRLGTVVTKTTFAEARPGNPSHRLTERNEGMINSIGIPSDGTATFRQFGLRDYQLLGVPVTVSVGGLSAPEYWQAADELVGSDHAALEVNVSCPNLEHAGTTVDADLRTMARVVSGVVARSTKPILVKLSPNLASIGDTAKAAQDAGASAVTVCNSFPGLSLDLRSRSSELGNGTGGLSGPAIKPLALRMAWQAARSVEIPVIGCGGIRTARDVAEFLVAGASAVQIGTANFSRPRTMAQLVEDLPGVIEDLGGRRLSDLIGTLTI